MNGVDWWLLLTNKMVTNEHPGIFSLSRDEDDRTWREIKSVMVASELGGWAEWWQGA